MLAVHDVAAGTKLLIAGGLTAEVIENMGDGEWLRIRVLIGNDTGAENCVTRRMCWKSPSSAHTPRS